MITSLLDNDFYQFTMANAINNAGDGSTKVRYEFRNRTFAVPLASRISLPQLREEIEKIRALGFYPEEIEFLRQQGIFTEKWLDTLPSFKLPEVEVGSDNGHLVMRYEGAWEEAIFWESMLLATVNELYFRRFGTFLEEGRLRLNEKIDYLEERGSLKFVEFGTRRRFSAAWQHFVTHELRERVPNLLLGTSNVLLARDLNLTPVGTMAHQLFMVYTALACWSAKNGETSRSGMVFENTDFIESGLNRVLSLWLDAYKDNPNMLTVLPDTYTTEAFMPRADLKLLSQFTAFRQDSGDPIAMGRKLEVMGNYLGFDRPKIMFSDSLDVRKMSVIEDRFKDIQMVSGWGTDLTNDLGYEPLSIVIKPSAVKVYDEWEPCAKLSDDPVKITGRSQDIDPYLRLIGA
jgi:nicotinate phosphoribosyltransferase